MTETKIGIPAGSMMVLYCRGCREDPERDEPAPVVVFICDDALHVRCMVHGAIDTFPLSDEQCAVIRNSLMGKIIADGEEGEPH